MNTKQKWREALDSMKENEEVFEGIYKSMKQTLKDMNTKQIQLKHVLDHLKSGETLTSVKANCIYSIKSLSSRISELRKQGHKIDSTPIGGGNVKYELDDNAPYEREFFDFLKSWGRLDDYIKFTKEGSGGVFALPECPYHFVYSAFTFSATSIWNDLAGVWHTVLGHLKSQQIQTQEK